MTTDQVRLTISVPEAARLLGISAWSYYEAIKRDELPHLRIGRRLVVPVHQLERYVEPPSPQPVRDTTPDAS